jgi:hypothetical protein
MALCLGTDPLLMRSVLACVLAGLLVVTTPIGTGHGVHQAELLHLLLPHLHFVDGHLVTHEQAQQAAAASATAADEARSRQPQAGPMLGADSGAEAASLGLAVTPTLPKYAVILPLRALGRLHVRSSVPPRGRLDTPPDPPPQATA